MCVPFFVLGILTFDWFECSHGGERWWWPPFQSHSSFWLWSRWILRVGKPFYSLAEAHSCMYFIFCRYTCVDMKNLLLLPDLKNMLRRQWWNFCNETNNTSFWYLLNILWDVISWWFSLSCTHGRAGCHGCWFAICLPGSVSFSLLCSFLIQTSSMIIDLKVTERIHVQIVAFSFVVLCY